MMKATPQQTCTEMQQLKALMYTALFYINLLKPTGYLMHQQFNLLKPSGFFMYHQVEHSKILYGACFALSVLYGHQNKQRLFPYTSVTDWLL